MSENRTNENKTKVARHEAGNALYHLDGLIDMFTGWAISRDEDNADANTIATFIDCSSDLLKILKNYFED